LPTFAPLHNANIDVAAINIAHEDLSPYKLLVIPGAYLMDQASADNIRHYISNGGTAIMTAFSATVNENNRWFDTPLPGRLSDVFGLRTSEFYRPETPLSGKIGDTEFKTSITFYGVLEPATAEVLGRFSNVEGTPPVATLNSFGKGKAIYIATPAQASVMELIYHCLCSELGIEPGPKTPEGVYARVVNGRTLYVNTTGNPRMLLLTARGPVY
jgi:beta-galactosidase